MKFKDLLENNKKALDAIIDILIDGAEDNLDTDYYDPDADQEYLINDMIDKVMEWSSDSLEDALDMELDELMDLVSDNRKKIVKTLLKKLKR